MTNPEFLNTERIAAEVVKSTLILAAQRPWELVSYAEIADISGLKAADIMAVFPQKIEILRRIVADLDQAILQSASADPALSFKEQLFELLMARFDEMAAHRAAHISFLKSFGWVKSQIPAELNLYYSSLWRYWDVCKNLSDDAGASAGDIGGEESAPFDKNFVIYAARYLNVLRVWSLDLSPDLGKTMAALNKL